MPDRLRVGLVNGFDGFRESRRCSTDTYPASFIIEYTQYTKMIYRRTSAALVGVRVERLFLS